MTLKSPRLLLFTEDTAANLYPTSTEYQVDTASNSKEFIAQLFREQYDVVVLDEKAIGQELPKLANTVKQRFPLTPLIAITHPGEADSEDMFEPYADEVVRSMQVHTDLPLAIERLLYRQVTQHRPSMDNQRLVQTINLIHDLHSIDLDREFLLKALTLLCDYTGTYAVSVLLHDQEMLMSYTVLAGTSPQLLYTSHLMPHEFDLFATAIMTRKIRVFEDITRDKNYVVQPLLMDVRAAVLIPFRDSAERLGAVALYHTGQTQFEDDDLPLFESFATHFALAFRSLKRFDDQERQIESSAARLEAWEALMAADDEETLIAAACEVAEESSGSQNTLFWSGSGTRVRGTADNDVQIEALDEMQIVFEGLHNEQALDDVINRVNLKQEPVLLWAHDYRHKPLRRLFEVMKGEYVVFLPLTAPGRMMGSIVLSFEHSSTSVNAIMERLTNLAGITGQLLAQLAIKDRDAQKSAPLETALNEIAHAVIIVGSTGMIAYMNPAAEAMLADSGSDSQLRTGFDVIERIADRTDNSIETFRQLTSALTRLQSEESPEQLVLQLQMQQDVRRAQFIRFPDPDQLRSGWVLLVHNGMHSPPTHPTGSTVGELIDKLQPPHVRLREIVYGLGNLTETGSKRLYTLTLRGLEHEVENVGLLWNNLVQSAQPAVEASHIREDIDLNELVQMVLESRFLRSLYRRCRVNYVSFPLIVRVDIAQITQALTNVLAYALEHTPSDTEALIEFGVEADHVTLLFTNQRTALNNATLNHLRSSATPLPANDALSVSEFAMHIAHQMVAEQGGQVDAKVTPLNALMIGVRLPMSSSPAHIPVARVNEIFAPSTSWNDGQGGTSTPERKARHIGVFRGSSSLGLQLVRLLQLQDYELHFFEGHEVFQAVDMRLDLIAIDVQQEGESALSLYRSIRAVNQIPVILMADTATSDARVEALNLGVEDYLTGPSTNAELSARVNVILKRTTLSDRRRQPFKTNDMVIDFANRKVFLHDQPVELTRLEYDLLYILAINVGQVMTHHQILSHVWGPEYRSETQYLWVNIRRLRQKIESDPGKPFYIRTQPRSGYYFYQGDD